jgi:hypothetical protein
LQDFVIATESASYGLHSWRQQKFKEIMREAKPVDVGASRTAWYSNMSCNQCRRRVKLKAHDDIAKDKAIEMHEANLAHAVSGFRGECV